MLKLAGPPGAVAIEMPCVSTPRRAHAWSSRPVDPPEARPVGLGEPVVLVGKGVEPFVARGEEEAFWRGGVGEGDDGAAVVFAPLGLA